MFKNTLVFLSFFALIFINNISGNAINPETIKVVNAEMVFACSNLTAQRISSFSVVANPSLRCYNENVLISFELKDTREANTTNPLQYFLTQKGSCLVPQQLTSKICKRIRR